MLVRCNPGCKEKGGTTEGALNPDTDEVICKHCGVELVDVSAFTKRTMRSNGDIIKKTAKAFNFDCNTCKKRVETVVIDGEIKGNGCNNGCSFNVTPYMINSMINVGRTEDEQDEE